VDELYDSQVEDFFENNKIEMIIHCATDYARKQKYFYRTFESNVIFPMKLIEIGMRHNLRYFINTDSYFNKESMSYNALPNYSKTKKLFLNYLKDFTNSIIAVNMRLEHIYGENDNKDKFTVFLMDKMKKNEEINLTHGHQKRDFVYIGDVVNSYLKVIENITKIKGSYIELEIGTTKSVFLKEFIEFLHKELNSSSSLNYGIVNYRDDEIMNSYANNSLGLWGEELNLKFDFRNIESGIKEMVRKNG
jgi:nucleoside-diphosphate-sugar epimerase